MKQRRYFVIVPGEVCQPWPLQECGGNTWSFLREMLGTWKKEDEQDEHRNKNKTSADPYYGSFQIGCGRSREKQRHGVSTYLPTYLVT